VYLQSINKKPGLFLKKLAILIWRLSSMIFVNQKK